MGNLLVLALACALAACSRAAPPGNTLRFSIAADPSTLNPLFLHQDASSVEQQLARLSFEPFIDLDERGNPVPALLAEIPTRENGGLSADGRTIVYHLRPNARWSDGVPVTSDDVLYTLHAILDPRNPVRSHEGYDLIDRALARDAHTVVFHLRHAWAPAVMTYFSYGFSPQFVLPAHVLRIQERTTPLDQAAFNAAPSVGDGPYIFTAWHHGDNLIYAANPWYWRGKPGIAQLDVRIVPDPQTNLILLRSGQLDWNLIAPSQQSQLKGLAFIHVPTSVVAGIVLNTQHAPLNDPRIRRAIAMSIDRETISKNITLGAYPVTNTLQPQFSWAYDPNIKEPAYAPPAADSALDAAGWHRGPDGVRVKDGNRLELTYVQFPETLTGVRVATFVQEELRVRGFDVTIKSISNAQLFLPKTGQLASGDFDLAYVPFTLGADPDDSSILACGAPSNYMRWCDRTVDGLERQALATSSQNQRRRIYQRIGQTIAWEVPILYLFNAYYTYAYAPRLKNFAPNAFLPTWNAYDWKLLR